MPGRTRRKPCFTSSTKVWSGGWPSCLKTPHVMKSQPGQRYQAPLENPRTSTWQTVVNLITNAFFKAFLPGFEKEVRP